MSNGRKKIYWDSCVFLSWLQEDRDEAEMVGIREYAAQIDAARVVLVTSTITRAEVLRSKMSKAKQERFERFLKRSNVVEASVDPRVSVLSERIRDHYQRQKDKGIASKILGAMDAMHLATAIHYEVDEFHTFDAGGKGRHLGLLGLGSKVAGHKLTVCKPNPDQGRFPGIQ